MKSKDDRFYDSILDVNTVYYNTYKKIKNSLKKFHNRGDNSDAIDCCGEIDQILEEVGEKVLKTISKYKNRSYYERTIKKVL